MNQKQKDALTKIVAELEAISSKISDMSSDEQEKFDNLSEGLQAADSGQAIEQAASDLSEAAGLLEEAANKLSEVVDA